MTIYWQIAKFNFLKYLVYPTETIAIIIDSIINFVILIFFWTLFSSNNGQGNSLISIISYFMISSSVASLTFSRGYKFGRVIQKMIKDGQISNYMMKPLSLIPHIFVSRFIGGYGMNVAIGIFYLIGGIILDFPKSWMNIFIFILSFIIAISLSLSINVILATVQFYTIEAGSIKNVFDHVTRVFSGALVPLYLFPDWISKIANALPFAPMVYGPTAALTKEITNSTFTSLLIALIWAIVLNIFAFLIWKKSIKNYDAIGI